MAWKAGTASASTLTGPNQNAKGPQMGVVKNHTGKRFGKLVVISMLDERHKAGRVWRCLCDCGKITNVPSTWFTSGNTKSCGCYGREAASRANKTHGMTNTRLNSIWRGMKKRCLNTNNPSYARYGGRGINVCADWMDFSVFHKWAINNGYDDSLTIDRIDNDLGYWPSNCRWATLKQQSRNKSTNKLSQSDVNKILTDGRTNVAVAKDYGVSDAMISCIRLGKSWN